MEVCRGGCPLPAPQLRAREEGVGFASHREMWHVFFHACLAPGSPAQPPRDLATAVQWTHCDPAATFVIAFFFTNITSVVFLLALVELQ